MTSLAAQPWPAPWYSVFLATLRATGNITRAIEDCGITRAAVYNARGRFPRFKEAWDDARAAGIDDLEEEARRRAMGGSDFLLWKMLSSLRRETYGEKVQVDVNIERRITALAEQFKLDPAVIRAKMQEIMANADQPLELAPSLEDPNVFS